MIRSYFIIALRNLRKHFGFSLLNVLGLAVGIACCLLMGLYVYEELSHDRFHEHADRIVRVVQQLDYGDGERRTELTSPMLGPALAEAFPAIEHAVRLDSETGVVRIGETRFQEELIFADPAFFDVFSFGFDRGRRADALSDLQDVVLSSDAARKFFGEAEPLGQTLSIRLGEEFSDFTVAGVLAPIPSASSIGYDLLLSFGTLQDFKAQRGQNWGTLSGPTYLLLENEEARGHLEEALPTFVEESLPPNYATRSYELQRLADIHLDPGVDSRFVSTSDPAYVYLLSALALFVLILACINFTTLALGRSVSRVREVGVRKVVGAVRRQLMIQFWAEALVVSFVSLLAGLLLLVAVLPAFNGLVGKNLSAPANPIWLLVLAALLLGVSLLASSYPAIYLSRFHPIDVLRGRASGSGKHRLTHALIVVQFAVSIFLVISTLFMSKQLDLLLERDLGFDEEQVVRISSQYGSTWEGRRLFERYEARLATEPSVSELTGSMYTFADPDGMRNVRDLVAGVDTVRGNILNVTPGFLETFGIDLVRGRDFSEDRPADATGSVLVNESLVSAFGWEEPIGHRLDAMFGFTDATVVGVVRDFHFESLHERIEPVAIYVGEEPLWSFYARIGPDNAQSAVVALERAWRDVAPDLPFEIEFVDQAVDQIYRSEMQWAWLIRTGAGIAIFIACLGLLGLTSLAAARRRKEISIRQVLGASAEQIVVLLTGRFVVLVLVALAIATPLAYLAMRRWLDGFAYRIEVTPGVFLLAGAVAVGIAVLTVSTQAVRAALADPADALRSE